MLEIRTLSINLYINYAYYKKGEDMNAKMLDRLCNGTKEYAWMGD